MGRWFLLRRFFVILCVALVPLFSGAPITTSMASADPAPTDLTDDELGDPSDPDDEIPAELPLSEDEGTAAFWVNVRRFVLVIALVVGLFTLWSKIERNRAADSQE